MAADPQLENKRNKASGRKDQAEGGPNTGNPSKGGNALHRGSEQVRRTMSDARAKAEDYMSQGASQFREMTHEREGTAVLVAMVAGFGIGVLIGGAIAASQSRPRTWRDRLRDESEGMAHRFEGMGQRILDRLEQVLPDRISERMHR